MKISDFVNADLRYDISAIAADPELDQELQTRLIEIGLLAEPMEKPFGDRAIAALTRFQRQNNCDEPEFLGPQTAEILIDAPQTRGAAITLEALQTTVLKLRPLDSSFLGNDEKTTLQAGSKLDLTFFETERKHVTVVLSQPMQNSAVWYVFSDHVKIFGGEEPNLPEKPKDEKPPISAPSKPGQVKLAVPYKSQRDNSNNPDGACNVTCMSMCLEFLKIPRRRSSGQFEDELYAGLFHSRQYVSVGFRVIEIHSLYLDTNEYACNRRSIYSLTRPSPRCGKPSSVCRLSSLVYLSDQRRLWRVFSDGRLVGGIP